MRQRSLTAFSKGLVFKEPKPSLQHRHELRLTNGVSEVLPSQAFEFIVTKSSRRTRLLPKGTVVGYAKCNPIAIIAPEARVAGVSGTRYTSPGWTTKSGKQEMAH